MTRSLVVVVLLSATISLAAAQTIDNRANPNGSVKQTANEVKAVPAVVTLERSPSGLTERERYLLNRIEQLERRLADLEAHSNTGAIVESPHPVSTAPMPTAQQPTRQDPMASMKHGAQDSEKPDLFREITINGTVDAYYSFNLNRPIGRVNLLRAYDVSSESFSLNQAAIIVERAPDIKAGRRFGVRADLQYGQATETLQGNPFNEPRPQVYRPIWQAYATFVAPVGNGLTVDVGKFASVLGLETNYTKDNFNYSRSYFYNFLPFYHSGVRAKYPINDRVTAMYHFVNGANQTEDFNSFKSQHVALLLTPNKKTMWQINYYFGREQHDEETVSASGLSNSPMQRRLSAEALIRVPRGRLHILDTNAMWDATDKLTLAAEADYIINRVESFSAPSHIAGGAAYARYRFTPKFALAGRFEYLSDEGGLFSGVTQKLKETTFTADYSIADGFLLRGEWRRDFSDQPFFLTRDPDVLKREQNTLTVGLVLWFGRKQGMW